MWDPPHTATESAKGAMALRALLVVLKLPQYEECLLGLGFDDVAAYATFDDADVEAMEEALRTAGVPPGHLEKIMRTVRQCQDPKLRHKKGDHIR